MTPRAWADAALAGAAQLLFSSAPATGAVLLVAVAIGSPLHAGTMLAGLLTATAFAGWLRWSRLLLREGLFGFNGALVGLVWPTLFEPSTPGFWLLVPAAAGATWLHGQLLPSFSRRGIPALGLPSLVITWAVSIASVLARAPQPAATAPPLIQGPLAGWAQLAPVGETVIPWIPIAVLVGLAAAFTSRHHFGAVVVGATAGIAASVLLGGAHGLLWVGAFAYNTVPAAAGVGAVLLRPDRSALVAAAAVGAVTAATWALLTPSILALGLLPLTAPMHLGLYGIVLLTRSGLATRLGLTRLVSASGPAAGSAAYARPAPVVDVEALSGLLRRSTRVVALTGAGMSTESGVPDYRSQVGFWYDANAEDLVYQRFLASEASRRLYWRLQRRFMDVVDRSAPNPGHRALARLDAAGRLLGVVTQNVDGFHQAAGCRAERVVELHGSAHWVVCLGCGQRRPYRHAATGVGGAPPACHACGGTLKTETVSFGEPLTPARLSQAITWCQHADLLLVLGTSLQVEPASSLPRLARARNTPLVVVNRTPTPWDAEAALVIRADVGQVLRAAAAQLEAQRIRPLTRADFQTLCGVVDAWWGDAVRYLLHPVYAEHFADTSFVWEDDRGLGGFVLGFVSQTEPDDAYVHMIGVAPDRREQGIGRALHEHFFQLAARRGCHRVLAITVPGNQASLAFHRQLGFAFRQADAVWQDDVPVVLDYAGPGVHCVVMERKL